MTTLLEGDFRVISPGVVYSNEYIKSNCNYTTNEVIGNKIIPKTVQYEFKTQKNVPKLGLMMVGWGGNNGSTVTAGILANKLRVSWSTKEGLKHPNYFGSLTQASTINIGTDSEGATVYIPFKNILPMVNPNDFVLGGWDISKVNLGASMQRAQVLDYDLQQKLLPHMKEIVPLPSIYYPDFIAANQSERADNLLCGSKQQNLNDIRSHIKNFKLEKANLQ